MVIMMLICDMGKCVPSAGIICNIPSPAVDDAADAAGGVGGGDGSLVVIAVTLSSLLVLLLSLVAGVVRLRQGIKL